MVQLRITATHLHTEQIPMTIRIRPANRADLPRLTEIYNHYVIHTPVTFDVEPYTVERRVAWFEQFALTG